jgi:hypothetical protein
MTETSNTTGFGTSGTISTPCVITVSYPPCYESIDLCENCGYKDSCTKKTKNNDYPYPYPPIWHYQPSIYPTYTVTCQT